VDKKTQNIIIAVSTALMIFFAFLPSYAKYVAIIGVPIVCLVARFIFADNAMASKIALGTILAGIIALLTTSHPTVWVLEILLMIVVPIFLLWKALPELIAAEKEKTKKGKKADEAAKKIHLKKRLNDAIADIDDRESEDLRTLIEAIEDAEDALASFQTEIADHESQSEQNKSNALAPLNTDIEIAQENLDAKTTAFQKADNAFKNLDAKRFPKNTSQVDLDKHDKTIERAATIKNDAETAMQTAQTDLNAKKRAHAQEERTQNDQITRQRTADQAHLRSLEAARQTALTAKVRAEVALRRPYDAERRAAQTAYDEAIARLE